MLALFRVRRREPSSWAASSSPGGKRPLDRRSLSAVHRAFTPAMILLVCMMAAASPALAGSPAGPSVEMGPSNVDRLKLVLSIPIDQPAGYAGAPAVLGDTLFLQTPFPHRLWALGLSDAGARLRWSWAPPAAEKTFR